MGYISANGAPGEYHGDYTPLAFTKIYSVKSNILVRDVERMGNELEKPRWYHGEWSAY